MKVSANLSILRVWALALVLSFSGQAFSQPSPSLQELSISPELGYVLETHAADPNLSTPKTIIHIQEAHNNYDGQRHLVEILKGLVERYNIRLILVEGGQGDVNLSYLRSYGSAEKRRQIADDYLKQGLIGAEEYVDIVSDYPLTLWGVEDGSLYESNIRLFMEASALKPTLKRSLAGVREAVETLKPKVFSPTLIDFDAKSKAFDAQTLPLSEYAGFLVQFAGSKGVALQDFPQLVKLAQAHQDEQKLTRQAIPNEQVGLMTRLSQVMEKARFEQLIEEAKAVKSGSLSRDAFYAHLDRVVAETKIDLSPYPNLSAYLRYFKTLSTMDPLSVSTELEALRAALREALADTAGSKTLAEMAEELRLVEGLVDLSLSPKDYEQVSALINKRFTFAWPTTLNEQLRANSLAAQSYEGLARLNAALPTLQQFYQVTQARDDVLAGNVLKQLDETGQTAAILITGGFHGPQIAQRLRSQGLGVAVVVPRITQATDEQRYETVLKYKQGVATEAELRALNTVPHEPRCERQELGCKE